VQKSPADERPSRVFKTQKRFKAETKNLGKRVRRLRKANSWTLERAAENMHLDLKHLQKIEAGQLNVTLVTLVRIAEGLEIPMSDLFPRRRRN
jgi:transcriptional regulator with XRE-family HTH domain